MRRLVFLVPLLVLAAACSEEAQDILDPVAASAVSGSTAVQVTVDGSDYLIECTNNPCPVSSLIISQIAAGLYVWVPNHQSAKPTIYLPALKVGVILTPVTTPTFVVPPVAPPDPQLTGPATVQGSPVGGMAQIVCSDIPLALNIPDSGTWDFVSGDVTFEYVTWNAAKSQWVPTGQSSVVPFSYVIWNRMLAGTYSAVPPVGNLEYYATVSATLKRGTFETTVSHRLLCSRQGPPPPPPTVPPAPSLDGPTEYLGTRSSATSSLVCSLIGVTLISPDAGPWNFVSGERLIEFLRFDSQTQSYQYNGVTQTDAMSSSDWQALLNGTYTLDLQVRTRPFYFTFNVLVERGQYQHTISHRAVCGGVDFFKFPRPTVVVAS